MVLAQYLCKKFKVQCEVGRHRRADMPLSASAGFFFHVPDGHIIVCAADNAHQRNSMSEQLFCAGFAVSEPFRISGQGGGSVVNGGSDSFTAQNTDIRDIQTMTVNASGNRGEVIREDLSGHIDRDPGLQSQHHLRKGTVHIVNDVNLMSFFDALGNQTHPLFHEFNIFCHLFHRQIIAHVDRTDGIGFQGGNEEIQFSLTKSCDIVVFALPIMNGNPGE